jgi:Arc/MetJ family transcription regulator
MSAYLDLYIQKQHNVYTSEGGSMAVTMTSIRLDTELADEAAQVLGVKSRTEAIHVALREVVALKRFKNLMKKQAGKLSFDGYVE